MSRHMANSLWTARSQSRFPVSLEIDAILTGCRDGPRLDSEAGHALQKRFTDELFSKLETIDPGVTACLTAKLT